MYSYVKYNAELQNISIKEYMIRLFGKEYCEYNFDWEDLFSDALIKGYTVIGEQCETKYYLGLGNGNGRLSYSVLKEPKIFYTKEKAQEEANIICKNINEWIKDERRIKEYWDSTKIYVEEV
ncbi:MAG: hypothetical protein SOV85_01855 [Clostridium sp.]|nr:hypothetical protein [Clostridium sp.]